MGLFGGSVLCSRYVLLFVLCLFYESFARRATPYPLYTVAFYCSNLVCLYTVSVCLFVRVLYGVG